MRKLTFFIAVAAVVFFGFPNAAQAQTVNCCVTIRTTSGVAADVAESDCREETQQKPCAGEISPQPVRCFRAGGLIYAPQDTTQCGDREVSMSCLNYPSACQHVLQSTLVNCPDKKADNSGRSECDNTPSCTVFNSRCYSVYDKRVCSDIRDPAICGKFQACRFRDNQCLSLLEATASESYTEKSKIIPDCALRGTCRNTNDILKVLLNYVSLSMTMIGVTAFIMFIAGGVFMIIAFGSEEKFKKGQQMLVYAIIGIIVSVSAVLIVKFVLDAVGVEKGFRVF